MLAPFYRSLVHIRHDADSLCRCNVRTKAIMRARGASQGGHVEEAIKAAAISLAAQRKSPEAPPDQGYEPASKRVAGARRIVGAIRGGIRLIWNVLEKAAIVLSFVGIAYRVCELNFKARNALLKGLNTLFHRSHKDHIVGLKTKRLKGGHEIARIYFNLQGIDHATTLPAITGRLVHLQFRGVPGP